jgi:hypothetical protein
VNNRETVFGKFPARDRGGQAGWETQKLVGESAENLVARRLAAKGFHVHKAWGQHAAYDLMIFKTLEVKNDTIAATTGKVAVEVECSSRPSGLNTTTADFWVFVIGTDALLIHTAALRRLVRGRPARPANGGRQRIILLPVGELETIARKLL